MGDRLQTRSDSVLKAAFRRLVERFDLPPFEFHPRIEGWEVDFRLVGTNVLIECDGWTTHGLDRDQFERDRRRDDDLLAAGWLFAATPTGRSRRPRPTPPGAPGVSSRCRERDTFSTRLSVRTW